MIRQYFKKLKDAEEQRDILVKNGFNAGVVLVVRYEVNNRLYEETYVTQERLQVIKMLKRIDITDYELYYVTSWNKQ